MPPSGRQNPSDTTVLQYLSELLEEAPDLEGQLVLQDKSPLTMENSADDSLEKAEGKAEDKGEAKPVCKNADQVSQRCSLLKDSEPTEAVKPSRVLPKQTATSQQSSAPQSKSPVNPVKQSKALQSAKIELASKSDLENQRRHQLQSLLDTGLAPSPSVSRAEDSQKGTTDGSLENATAVEPIAVVKQLEAQSLSEPEAKAEEIPVKNSEAIQCQSTQMATHELLEWAANGRPMWAQERFDVLLFEVGGLSLAVPLIALGQIQAIDGELTPIFGQAEWFMGLLNTPTIKVRTVNTALFVMPERYTEDCAKAAKYVVSLDNSPWGLAVDKVDQPTSIDPSEVNWRGQRGKRPWLAGTVKSAMCALIDVPNLLKIFNQSDVKLAKKLEK